MNLEFERHGLMAKATAYAAYAHDGQTRKGGALPYILHPMETANIAATMTNDPEVLAAAMLHAGGTVFDALPHGSFFHATAGAVGIGVRDRLRLFPYGELVGATTTVVSVVVYMIAR